MPVMVNSTLNFIVKPGCRPGTVYLALHGKSALAHKLVNCAFLDSPLQASTSANRKSLLEIKSSRVLHMRAAGREYLRATFKVLEAIKVWGG